MKPLYTFDRGLFLIASAVVGGYLLIHSVGSVVSDIGYVIAGKPSDDTVASTGSVAASAENEVPIPDLNVDGYCRLKAAKSSAIDRPYSDTSDPTETYNRCFDEQQVHYNAVKDRWSKVSTATRDLCSEIVMRRVTTGSLLAMGSLYMGLDDCLAAHQTEEKAFDGRQRLMQAPPRRELQR